MPPKQTSVISWKSTCTRPTLSAPLLNFLTIGWIVLVDNLALWRELSSRIDLAGLTAITSRQRGLARQHKPESAWLVFG